MSFPLLLRRPVVWLVICEVLLIAGLGVAAWHIWVGRQTAAPAAAAPSPVGPAPRRAPLGPTPFGAPRPGTPSATPGPAQAPGLRTDPAFLARQMNELNRVEATFENLEWRVTRAVVDAIQYYVDSVVLPSIERTERAKAAR